MGEELKGADVAAVARLAGVTLNGQQQNALAQQVPALLAAVRSLPAGQQTEPMLTFAPAGEANQ